MIDLKIRTALLLLIFSLSANAAAPRVELQPVATELDQPVAITHAGDSRLFVTLQPGRIVIVDAAGTRDFLDLRSIVRSGGERGLLSVAFHPDYAANGFFYVYYTDAEGDIVIARYQRSGDPDRADPGSRMLVLEIPHRDASNHNGGQLQFGPDDYLYAGTGDGGGGGDPMGSGQRLNTLLGKLLRIDVNGALPYDVPFSNPYRNTAGARPEIWAYGLRNPWRFTFDRLTGDLWIADVGQNRWEEVNLQPATSTGGENYGWNRMEGTHCFSPSSNCNDGTLTLPVIEYGREDGCSITGGYRYRGTVSPRLAGMYIYGDLCSGRIWGAFPLSDGTWRPQELIDTDYTITTFGEDVNGEIYVADHAGTISRIVDTAPLVPRGRAVRH